MDILVKISTAHEKPSKSVAAGYAALLNAILRIAKVVDGVRRSLSLELHAAHGPEGASYMWELLPTLGEVQSVKFVPADEAAAAGEVRRDKDDTPAGYIMLGGLSLNRARAYFDKWVPTHDLVHGSVCPETRHLLGIFRRSDNTLELKAIPLAMEVIRDILDE